MVTFLRRTVFSLRVALLSMIFVPFVMAAGFPSDLIGNPLKAEEAFKYEVSINEKGDIIAHFNVMPGFYLYRDQFKFSVENSKAQLGVPLFPESKLIQDKELGDYRVYEGEFSITIPVKTGSGPLSFVARYQGCAAAGFCYPPLTTKTGLNLPLLLDKRTEETEQSTLVTLLSSENILLSLLTFFLLGIGLAFTPCVLPMVPILSSIIVGEAEIINTKKAFRLSLTYVFAMAFAYALLGALVGAVGSNLQVAFQHPWAIGFFALLFALLALSMFGLYEIALPQAISRKMHALHIKQSGGDFYGAAVMGFFSTFLVSPCLTPALAAALIYIGEQGSIPLGASVLFAMGLGMGVPLILVGTLEGNILPKTGAWMQIVKSFFGVLLLLVAISMADRIIPRPVTLLLLGTLAIIFGVYVTVLFPGVEKKTHPGWWAFWRGVSLVIIIWGILWMLGAASKNHEIMYPLKAVGLLSLTENPETVFHQVVTTPEALRKSLDDAKKQGKPAVVNFSADWCVSCKKNETIIKTSAALQNTFSRVVWIKADITQQNADSQSLMEQYDIIAPPTFLFFDAFGNENPAKRLVGQVDEAVFLKQLE